MKNFLKTTYFLTMVLLVMHSAIAQSSAVLKVTFGQNYPASTGFTSIDVFVQAGAGYVRNDAVYDGSNVNGSWEGINLRFTTATAPILQASDFTIAFPPSSGFGGSSVFSNVSASVPCGYTAAFNTVLYRNSPALDAGSTPVKIATITFPSGKDGSFAVRSSTSTATTGCPARESFWGNSAAANSGFHGMALGNSITLPVTFTNFSGKASGCVANLSWATALEQNSSYYNVEYSTDGKTFTTAGKVTSSNKLTGASYNYGYDNLGSGTYYFRLKAVDFDGEFAYSAIVAVSGTGACSTGLSLKVSPNPTSDVVNIEGLISGSQVSLLSISGQKMTEVTANSTSQTISLSGYAKGVYIVRVQQANGTVSNVKVVKN